MRILKTHAASFIGFHLTEQVATEGHKIANMDRLITNGMNSSLSDPASEHTFFTESCILSLILLVTLNKEAPYGIQHS